MKLLKYLLCIIFLFFYIVIGFVLVILNATLDFLKTIPHVWRTAVGNTPKKRSMASNADWADITKGVKESLAAEIQADEVEELKLNPEDMWVSYLDRWGNG